MFQHYLIGFVPFWGIEQATWLNYFIIGPFEVCFINISNFVLLSQQAVFYFEKTECTMLYHCLIY